MKKKLLVIGVVLAMGLTACGNNTESSAEETETTADVLESQSGSHETLSLPPVEPDSSAEESVVTEGSEMERLLAGTLILNLTGTGRFRWDLDQDGSEETILFEPEGEAPYDMERYTLTVGDHSVTEWGALLTGEIYLASFDQETLQLLVAQYGYTGRGEITVWAYQNGALEQAGELGGTAADLKIEKGVIYCSGNSQVFQTWDVAMLYQWEAGKLQEIPQELYEMGNTVTALRDIATYSEKDGNEDGIVLQAGSRVIVIGTDNKEWVKLQNADSGEFGWVKITEGTYTQMEIQGKEVEATEAFEGLILAG